MKTLYYILLACLSVSLSAQAQQYELVKLSSKINSNADEGYPMLSHDANKIYFSRTFHHGNEGGEEGGQDVWYSDYNGKRWVKASNALTTINDEYNNVVSGWTYSGDTMYVQGSYDSKENLKAGISYIVKTDNGWSEPEEVKVKGLLIKGQYYGMHVHPSSKYIIFSMNSFKTIGEEDLYVAIQNEKGGYDKPIHLGSVVNTTGYEISPFLSYDTKTLYFASNGLGGEGDVDIFKATRLDSTWTNWSKPENLGAPINSANYDAFFTIGVNGDAFFSSNRKEELADIYWLKGYTSPYSKDVKVDQVLAKEDTTEETPVETESGTEMVEEATEMIEEVIDVSEEVVEAIKEEKPVEKSTVVVTGPGNKDKMEKPKKGLPEKEKPVKNNTPVLTKEDPKPEKLTTSYNNTVFFDFNSWSLNHSAKSTIKDEILKKIKGKQANLVMITGHADNVGSPINNQKVSVFRAESVKDFLIEMGISKDIIRVKGFGEMKPIESNETTTGRSKNRRVEIEIK